MLRRSTSFRKGRFEEHLAFGMDTELLRNFYLPYGYREGDVLYMRVMVNPPMYARAEMRTPVGVEHCSLANVPSVKIEFAEPYTQNWANILR